MGKKIEGIEKINRSVWMIYKDYLAKRDKKSYRNLMEDVEYGCEDEILRLFCHNISSAWETVVELLENQFKNGMDTGEITEHVMDIQNSAWAAYKAFLLSQNVKGYTEKAAALVHRYGGKKDMMLFAQTLILSWVPVINSLAKDFRDGSE